ncbi:MAG: hypothetical protein HGA65_19240, partial [Oscillochloris sp.]|nr:hypothetical protein [Oscillochloris sp.]
HLFKLSVADALERSQPEAPGWLLSYLRAYDADQTWLINHSIGLRHQEHKVFYLTMIARYPDRQIEAPEGPGEPVVSTLSVGIVGWSFASVSVIDFLGLNDSVIAHNPELRTDGQMAHERQPPPGYLECFDPGLAKADLKVRFVPAERIRSCEARFWNQMTSASQTP